MAAPRMFSSLVDLDTTFCRLPTGRTAVKNLNSCPSCMTACVGDVFQFWATSPFLEILSFTGYPSPYYLSNPRIFGLAALFLHVLEVCGFENWILYSPACFIASRIKPVRLPRYGDVVKIMLLQ